MQHTSCPGGLGGSAGRGVKSPLPFQEEFLWRRNREEKELRREEISKRRSAAEPSENMSWCWCLSLWTGLSAVFRSAAAQDPSYTPRYDSRNFEEAAAACSPGLLTTLATKHEVDAVLAAVSRLVPPPVPNEATFWVGLQKAKNECMVPALPLKGFKWTADGSEAAELSPWLKEPEHTCTIVGCAALRARLHGPNVTGWGLVPVLCRTKTWFICKHTDSQTLTAAVPEPTSPGPGPGPEPEPGPGPGPGPGPEPEPGPGPGPGPGPELRPSQPAATTQQTQRYGGPGRCRLPGPTGIRSLVPDPGDDNRIQVECWTPGVLVELRCSGRPAQWRLLDGSAADFGSICAACDPGFHKKASGRCEDVDECSAGGACRGTCLNTPGSYKCVCTDEDGRVLDEDSPGCEDVAGPAHSGLLVPVLVAVGALVILVVLVAVVIKCCMVRRSKRRAAKNGEAAEKMSLDSKDETKSAI